MRVLFLFKVSSPRTARRHSHLQDLLFLPLEERVDLGDRVVGLLLQGGLGAALVVLARFALFLQLAQVLHHVAADVANRDPALLGDAVHHLDHLAAALLGQLGDLQADDVAVVARRQADVGLLDRFLDRPDRALVEGRHGEQAGVGGGDVGQLLERRLRHRSSRRRCGRAGAARRGRCAPWPARRGWIRPTWPSGLRRP